MADFAAKVELLDVFNDHGGHSPAIDGENPDFGGIIRRQFEFEPICDCGRISHAGKAMNHELMDGDFSGSEAIFKERGVLGLTAGIFQAQAVENGLSEYAFAFAMDEDY